MHNVCSVIFHVAWTSGASIKGHPLAMNMTSYPPLSMTSPAGLKPPPNRSIILHSRKTGDDYQQFHLQTNSTMYPGKTRTANLRFNVFFTQVL